MWSVKLDKREIKLGFLLLGSLLMMASFLGACGDAEIPLPGSRSYFASDYPRAPSKARVSRLMWSGDGKHILFSGGGLTGVYVVDHAGRELRAFPESAPLIGDRYNPGAFAPALSADGTRVAYSAFAPLENIVIETAAFDGTDVRRLTELKQYLNDEGDVFGPFRDMNTYPVWSPDGKQIAFIRSLDRDSTDGLPSGDWLYIMNADGSNVWALAPSVPSHLHAAVQPVVWSPDGSRLALVGLGSVEGSSYLTLYTVKPDGSAVVRIGDFSNYRFGHLYSDSNYSTSSQMAWSPDGSRLAFVGVETNTEGDKRYGGYIVQPDGSGLTEVTPSGYGAAEIAWSPDSAWLALTNGQDVSVARPDGSGMRQVASGQGGPLVWTPDGEELLIGGLQYAVRPDGSGLREWVSGGVPEVAQTAWSPDGSRLAVLTVGQYGLRLYTLARDGTDRRLLARGSSLHIVAEHSDWRDVSDDIAACAELYKDNPGLVEDCQTLLSIRDALAGETLLNWSADVHIGEWEGVSVEGGEGADLRPPRVRKLVLAGSSSSGHYITGIIPPELGNLSQLEILNLGRNTLTGTIPPELGNLTKLEALYLTENNLTGSIPPELGNLASLESLELSSNLLSGSIPLELGNLENLRVLMLHRNYDLSGCVPAELANRLDPEFGTGFAYCE